MLVEAAQTIKAIADKSTRKRYAEALADSLRMDTSFNPPEEVRDDPNIIPSDPPNICSPKELSEKYKISIDDQYACQLVLRRKQIKDFMKLNYARVLKTSEITRRFKSEAYDAFFGKVISRCGNETENSPTVYSYAEVLQRLGFVEQVSLPDEVKSLFDEVGISFP